jgi:acyl-CoA thioester hydrolase
VSRDDTGPPAAAPHRFEIAVRVYYEDTDAGGIVYHASWLRFMERVRTDWLRSLGARHVELAERDRLLFVVAALSIRYLRPARLDDLLRIDLEVLETRRASLRLAQRAWATDADGRAPPGTPLIDAEVRVAAVRRAGGRPAPLPGWLLNLLGHE